MTTTCPGCGREYPFFELEPENGTEIEELCAGCMLRTGRRVRRRYEQPAVFPVELPPEPPCRRCGGEERLDDGRTCPACRGTGRRS